MSAVDRNAICASVEVAVPAETAFAFMADGLKQDHWALGSMGREALGDGLFRGRSSFDGSDLYVRLESHPELLLVDYATGPSPQELVPHVEARIRPGSWLGRDDSVSVVTLTIWRDGADDEEWEFHFHLWRTEVRLIKGAIERGL
ncbi:MAG TPA: hypothetical protein VEB65_11560 [Solirubrobacterales bacterium]|nr:hypothetical protein [Solirubrobacterales bacterium]